MQPALPIAGDILWIRQRRWKVERAIRDRNLLRLDVASRNERLTFLAPFDRPAPVARVERPRRVRPQGALARLARLLSDTYGLRTVLSAIDADITILPHQLEPALAVASGARRILVADEVGLGKTIQAGLVIAEILRQSAPRVLVIVPAALIDQWIAELGRRFRISCLSADRTGLETAAQAGSRNENPWSRSSVWVGSFDYVKQPHVFDSIPLRPWDLLVIDEAHDVAGESERHAACAELARRARHVLLLTATPHSGDEMRFTRLTDIGALTGVDDSLTVFRRTRAALRPAAGPHVRWHRVTPAEPEVQLFRALGAFEQAALRAAGTGRREIALLLLSVFRKRALSTMGALATSLERRSQWLEGPGRAHRLDWMQPRLLFEGSDTDQSDDIGADERESLTAEIGMDSRHERVWIRRLRTLADAARRSDSKVERLAALVERSREPLVVFTEFRHSLDVLRRRLADVRPLALLHGGLAPAERRQELERFLRGDASILLATDVAAQGLNLQYRTRWVVCLELPWNPARLEQRAGRVDRIGQSRPVHVTLLVGRHDAESGILARLTRRVLAARGRLGPDVLPIGAPDDATLRGLVLGGVNLEGSTSPEGPAGAEVRLSRQWERPARIAARLLLARRQLRGRWRSPAGDAQCPAWTTAERWPALGIGRDHAAIALFSVPLVDRSGTVVERHLVAARIARAIGMNAHRREVIEAARTKAARSIAARAHRADRRLKAARDLGAARERAILEGLAAIRCPEEMQAGLFNRRALREFNAARREASALRSEAIALPANGDRLPVVTIGRPALELMFVPRA